MYAHMLAVSAVTAVAAPTNEAPNLLLAHLRAPWVAAMANGWASEGHQKALKRTAKQAREGESVSPPWCGDRHPVGDHGEHVFRNSFCR